MIKIAGIQFGGPKVNPNVNRLKDIAAKGLQPTWSYEDKLDFVTSAAADIQTNPNTLVVGKGQFNLPGRGSLEKTCQGFVMSLLSADSTVPQKYTYNGVLGKVWGEETGNTKDSFTLDLNQGLIADFQRR